MASIEQIRKRASAWKARDGSIRYYVNDWKDLIGLNVEYHKSGNVSAVWFDDRDDDGLAENDPSNRSYGRYLAPVKVWFDEGAQLHIDHLDDEMTEVRARILRYVDAAYTERVCEPRTPRQLIQMSLCAYL